MELHIFNPENDLALADGGIAYCPPPHAARIAYDLASLPLWYAGEENAVLLPDILHTRFHNDMSAIFRISGIYKDASLNNISTCMPWGWSPQIKRRLKALGIGDEILPDNSIIERIRTISNRQTSISILSDLRDAGIDIPHIPLYITEPDKVAAFIESMPRSVIKAPWSGSGKGIAWGIGHVERPVENFYKGIIKRQGGVICEHFLDCVQEFAMEFHVKDSNVSFAGYSLFEAVKGSYSGNFLATDEKIESVIAGLVPSETLRHIKRELCRIITNILAGTNYKGYIGVDMMVYRSGNAIRLNPCLELNMRTNMGVVSRIFHDRHVAREKEGEYRVSYYKKSGDALREHTARQKKHPLIIEDGRIESGYVSLSPVTEETQYVAHALIR